MIIEGINQFSYKGKRSYDDIGLILTRPPETEAPERDVEYVPVPGRSGDVILDNNRFSNITKIYSVAAAADVFDLSLTIKKMRPWLQGDPGYFVLSDTYEPDYYYMASYAGQVSYEEYLQYIGTAPLTFNCKPFRYRIDGQRPVILNQFPSVIYNPEDWESAPHIKITGDGDITLHVNNSSFSLLDVSGDIEIDSEMMMIHKGTDPENEKAQFSRFPKLEPGMNNISCTGAVTQISIIPRWCCL